MPLIQNPIYRSTKKSIVYIVLYHKGGQVKNFDVAFVTMRTNKYSSYILGLGNKTQSILVSYKMFRLHSLMQSYLFYL